jgi:hypothetical protein
VGNRNEDRDDPEDDQGEEGEDQDPRAGREIAPDRTTECAETADAGRRRPRGLPEHGWLGFGVLTEDRRDRGCKQQREAEEEADRQLLVAARRRDAESEDATERKDAALQSIDDAGGDATDWLRAVTLARALETLS